MKKLLLFPIIAALMCACSSVNCPLNNIVQMKWQFSSTLDGTLTVSTNRHDGNDTVLVNQNTQTDSLLLPMSYTADEDTFQLDWISSDSVSYTDHIIINKQNLQHFESIECSPTVYHYINSVETDGVFIDSVRIANPNVTNNTNSANIIIYTSTSSD